MQLCYLVRVGSVRLQAPVPPLGPQRQLIAGGRKLGKQNWRTTRFFLKALVHVWKRKPIKAHKHVRQSNTHTAEVHSLYLFDIVACLCTCFNKQNIHVFCSLLSLLCGYLSVMSHTRPRHANTYTHTHIQTNKGEKYTVCDCVVVDFQVAPLPPAAAAAAISSRPKVIHLSTTSYSIFVVVVVE